MKPGKLQYIKSRIKQPFCVTLAKFIFDQVQRLLLIVDQSNSEILTISTVCNSETGQTTYALLVELPVACSRFAALKDCLKVL